jgi:hypothetical protein
MFKKTHTITVEEKAIVIGDERQEFKTKKATSSAFKKLFTEISDDPAKRIEMQEQDVWTIYEREV